MDLREYYNIMTKLQENKALNGFRNHSLSMQSNGDSMVDQQKLL